MRKVLILVLLVLLVVATLLLVLRFRGKQEETPRQHAIQSLQTLQQALQSSKQDAILDAIAIPAHLKSRTLAEQAEFVTKALQDEISPEGIAALKTKATFGPLRDLFPAEAAKWSGQAGVAVSDCVAFKAEQNGLRTEVVIATNGPQYKIVRLNNVKQLGMK